MLLHFLWEFVLRCTVLDSRERIWPWERNWTRCYSTSLEFVYRCTVLDVRERIWPWQRNRTRSYCISFENLCSDALFLTHGNKYDLESEIGQDATPLLWNLFRCTVLEVWERIWPWQRNRTRCYCISFENLCSDALFSTHKNEYDLESEIGPDATPLLWNLCTGALFSPDEKETDLESGIGPEATPFPLRICVPMHCSQRTRTNMTLRAE